METKPKFIIPFVGLKLGETRFSYKIDKSFFEARTYSEIQKGELLVELLFNKQTTMLVLDFKIKGNVEVICDRCSEEFTLPVSSSNRLIVRITNDENEGDGIDVITILPSAAELDVEQFIYEFIILALPLKRVHPDDKNGDPTCNPEVLEKLKSIKTTNNNNQEQIDPRWLALKNIKLN